MKTFKDLIFKPHPVSRGEGKWARMMFPNGYGISVVRFKLPTIPGFEENGFRNGYGSYTCNEQEWEVAVLKGNETEWDLCYSTPITDDVLGNQTEEQVIEIMKKVQEL